MLLAHDLSTDLTVSAPGKLPALPTPLSMPRADVDLSFQFCRGSTLAAPPTGSTVFYGIKAKDATKLAWLSLVQLLPVAGSTGLYQATLQNNTPTMIADTHADPADQVPEVLNFPAWGQLFYFTTDAPGHPKVGQLIDTTVTTVLWKGSEGIAPDPNVVFPSAAALARAVAQAAAAVPIVSVTALTGGAGTLDHVATIALATYQLLLVNIAAPGGAVGIWRLEPDTDPLGGAAVVTTADHDPATNARSLRQRL